jgi:predicted  nucleic acid-binding Zn-ribbon protein
MKTRYLAIMLSASIVIFAGCKRSDEKATASQFDKVKDETKTAAEEIKNYTFAQKNEFVTKMQSQLARINRDLDELSVKVEKSSAAAKAEWQPKLQALRHQADKLRKQLDEAKGATESTWDEVKAGSKKAYGELKDGFQRARQWVSDKIAP